MVSNKIIFTIMAILLVGPGASSGTEAGGPGAVKYLQGDLDGALDYWSKELVARHADPVTRILLGNGLIIKGKQSLLSRNYEAASLAFKKASELFPERKELYSLRLLSELESKYPTGHPIAVEQDLSATNEKNIIFDILFSQGLTGSARATVPQTIVHVVQDGETLGTIAIKYYKNFDAWTRIWKKNPHLRNPHRLFPGTKLFISLP